MLNILIGIIGCAIIFSATEIYRPNDKIEVFSKHWFYQIILISIGLNLYSYSLYMLNIIN